MFLCPPCHGKTRCKAGWIEEMRPSYGPCEDCKTVGPCLDCHGY